MSQINETSNKLTFRTNTLKYFIRNTHQLKHNMRSSLFLFLLLLVALTNNGQPVFKNPGISDHELFVIKDFIDNSTGYVDTKIEITLKERNNQKYYTIHVEEGTIFLNEIEVNYNDLTTISEKRIDKRTNSIEEYFENRGNGVIHFFNKEKGIDKLYNNTDKNIYSRYAYFISFRGFPFESSKSETFSTYMYEYGDALSMKVTILSKEKVSVKAGTFECYKMELSVAGWLSLFAPYKSYLYFTVDGTHQFIKYEEKSDNGGWNVDELIKVN